MDGALYQALSTLNEQHKLSNKYSHEYVHQSPNKKYKSDKHVLIKPLGLL